MPKWGKMRRYVQDAGSNLVAGVKGMKEEGADQWCEKLMMEKGDGEKDDAYTNTS